MRARIITDMEPQRIFMGWTQPPQAAAAERLLASARPQGRALDLSDTLVLTPTRQAARRLREALTLRCAQDGQAVLGARALTPGALLAEATSCRAVAGPLALSSVWVEVLRREGRRVRSLFPHAETLEDPLGLHAAADLLHTLRETLCDGGYDIAGAAARMPVGGVEQERWSDLAHLEQAYRLEMERNGWTDPADAKRAFALRWQAPEDVRRVVLVALPDPSLLLLRALASATSSTPVEVLIAAPASEAEAFDAWGRPLPEIWGARRIDIPNPARDILTLHHPREAAEAVLRRLEEEGVTRPESVLLGAPLTDAIPYLETALARRGYRAFDPSDRALGQTEPGILAQTWMDAALSRRVSSIDPLIRHPRALCALERLTGESSRALLEDWDKLRVKRLPWSADAVPSGLEQAGSALKAAWPVVEAWLRARDAAGLRAFLAEVYADAALSRGREDAADFPSAAEALDRLLAEAEDLCGGDSGTPPEEGLRLLRGRVQAARIPPAAVEDAFTLDGWLETPWSEAPLAVIVGVNEGAVPDGRLSDPFLPDGARRALGLRDDDSRLARDAFLLTGLLEQRRDRGRVVLLVCRTSARGDPLKPSRLLFRCADDRLPERADLLFAQAEAPAPRASFTRAFRLRLPPPDEDRMARFMERPFWPSAFAPYLFCPFRFYLTHVLGMERPDDDAREPDARAFGQALHEALKGLTHDPGLLEARDEAPIADGLERRLRTIVQARYGPALSLPARMALDAGIGRLRAAAREQARLYAEGWMPIASEEPFDVRIGPFHVHGRIDRIDRHASTGALRVIDYKTSESAKAPLDAHLAKKADNARPARCMEVDGDLRSWTDLQLPLYAESLAQRHPGAPIETAYFNLPKALDETGLALWPDFGESVTESAMACAADALSALRAGCFWPPAEKWPYDPKDDPVWILFQGNPEDGLHPDTLKALMTGNASCLNGSS